MGLLIDLQSSAGPALVIGGGVIAARKIRNLAEAEFEIVVVAPEIADEIRLTPHIGLHERAFDRADLSLRPFCVVFACTSDRAVNRHIGELARAAEIPVVVADAADESTFFTPATIRQGDLAIAVSTGGASPAQARAVREAIVAALAPRWNLLGQRISADQAAREARRAVARRDDSP